MGRDAADRERLLAGCYRCRRSKADAFTDADLPFFDALAHALEERILDPASR